MTSNFLLLLLFGYLIGSISPGYFFGRLIKGIDIRNYNRRNTGATNTYLTVGPVYGILAGIFDFLKAAFVYFVGFLYLGSDLAILPGLAAVAGHIFPFELGFRGGRGVASLYGVLLLTLFFSPSIFSLLLFIGIIVYALKITDQPVKFDASFRRLAKLAALILPFGFIWEPESTLFITKILLILVLAFDLLRFLIPKLNLKYLGAKSLAKQKELKTFSGYTLFLLSAFLIFSFFPKEIAALSLIFFILGDLFGPLAGNWFLPKFIFKDKTLGGAGLIFGITFIAGLYLNSLTLLSIPLKILAAGAALTAILDQFSFILDDNILVPLGTAVILSLF